MGAGPGASSGSCARPVLAATRIVSATATTRRLLGTGAPRRTVGPLHGLRAELHVMGAAQVLLEEVHLEGRRQLLAVPAEAAHELLVVGARLIPVGQERGGYVHAGAVPALRDHVDLLAGDALVGLPGLLGIGD